MKWKIENEYVCSLLCRDRPSQNSVKIILKIYFIYLKHPWAMIFLKLDTHGYIPEHSLLTAFKDNKLILINKAAQMTDISC